MPGAIIGLILSALFCLQVKRWLRRKRLPVDLLDAVLLALTPYDCFSIRDLLNGGIVIFGRPGAGKTSSSGRTILRG